MSLKNSSAKIKIPKILKNKLNNKKIGQIASGIYSPRLKKNIGLSMVIKDYWDLGNEVFVYTFNG